MIVYLITTFSVFVLTCFFKSKDCYSDKITSSGKVIHTSEAKIFLFLTCAFLIFVAGFRYCVGMDYAAYFQHYSLYADDLILRIKTINEPGFSVICAVSKLFGATDGSLALLFASVVTISLVLSTLIRNTDETQYAVLLYIFMGCWTSSFNAVRQTLAAAFLFAGLPYLREKKLFKFLFFVFLAFLCHKSAILMALLYFLVHRNINIFNLILMLVVVLLLLGSYTFLFEVAENVLNKNYNMDNSYINTSVNILRILVGISPALFFGFSLWNKEKSKIEEFYLNILFIHAMVNLITLNSAYLARITIYSSPFAVLSICELSKTIELKNRKIVMFSIVLLYFLFWMYQVNNMDSLKYFAFLWQK